MVLLKELVTIPEIKNNQSIYPSNDTFSASIQVQFGFFNEDYRTDDETKNENRISDLVLGSLFIIPLSIVILFVYFLYLLTIRDKGTFFYKCRRLGKGKRLFSQLKIRTLVNNAESSVGKKIYYDGQKKLELWYGMFLRKTRIDELPQIYNILKGDMSFIGPRPIRPMLYDEFLHKIENFDKRFLVRPGLTGYAQFLTPPNTGDKKIRSRIDNMFIQNKPGELQKIGFVLWTLYRCTYLVFLETFRITYDRFLMMINGKSLKNERNSKREKPKHVYSQMFIDENSVLDFKIININSDMMLIESHKKIELHKFVEIKLSAKVYRRRSRIKRVICSGIILSERNHIEKHNLSKFRYLISYKPRSDFHRYIVDKYILKTSVA